jgi:hypothetical protein
MSTVYALVPTILPASITLPQDLVDQRSAASVNDPITAVANGVAYLNQSGTINRRMGCGDPVGATRTGAIAKTYDLKNVRLDSWETKLFTCYGNSMRCPTPDAGALATHLLYDISDLMIEGSVVTRITLDLVGNVGTHGALPAMMPALGVVRYSPSADTWESLLAAGMQDDASADVAAYETAHDIRLTPDQNNTVSLQSYAYYAVLCPEGSTDAQDNLQFRTLSTRSTAPRYQT